MAPFHSRQLLAWSLPTVAIILSYFWFRKRRRIGVRSDPGGKKALNQPTNEQDVQTSKEEEKRIFTDKKESCESIAPLQGPEQGNNIKKTEQPSPQKERTFSRSLSGVESEPIDIIIPRELRSVKSNPVVISDEELDLEIKKIQSMKNSTIAEPFSNSRNAIKSKSPPKGKVAEDSSVSPPKQQQQEQQQQQQQQQQEQPPKQQQSSVARINGECTPQKIKENPSKKEKTPSKMAQKDLVYVQKKFNSLKLDTKDTLSKKKGKSNNNNNNNNTSSNNHNHNTSSNINIKEGVVADGGLQHQEELLQRQSSERDSANHSPADVMLASPSLSSISDNHSEGSNDSGKGGSDVATPPSRTPACDGSLSEDLNNMPAIYEFVIPQSLVGRLIGRHGSFVSEIKNKTRAHILIKKHPGSIKLKVCAVEGTQIEIDNALQLIRDKFPQKRYPEVTLEQVSFLPAVASLPVVSENLYLKLIEGINNDTIVSCMVAPNHLFLQQPTHPTFPSLNVLCSVMNMCYSEANSPLLPTPIAENTICVAHSVGAWYRAIVLSTDVETDTSYVKFLDYGGYAYVDNSKLRQIRGDFLLLPFQAAECVLANIRPIGGQEAAWDEEAYTLVAELTKGAIIYTQIVEYTEETLLPLVLCYVVVGPQQIVFLNEELVNRGLAEWIPCEQDDTEGAVGGVEA